MKFVSALGSDIFFSLFFSSCETQNAIGYSISEAWEYIAGEVAVFTPGTFVRFADVFASINSRYVPRRRGSVSTKVCCTVRANIKEPRGHYITNFRNIIRCNR